MLCKQLTGTEGTPVLKQEHLKKYLWRNDQVTDSYYAAHTYAKCTPPILFVYLDNYFSFV